MLVNLYRSRTPIAVVSLPLLIAVVSSSIFFKEVDEYSAFFQWQTDLIQQLYLFDWLHFALVVALISTTAHQFSNLFNRRGFFNKASFLPGLIYVLCLFSFDQIQFTMDLVSHLFLVFALDQIFGLRRQEDAKARVFKSGLFIGLAICCSPILIPFIFVPWIGLAIFRAFVWREWVLPLLGFIIPVIYLFSMNYILTDQVWVPLSTQQLQIQLAELDLNIYELSSRIYLSLVILYTIWKLLVVASTEVVRFKKQTRMLLIVGLALAIPLVVEWLLFEQFIYALAIPLSIIMSVAFLNGKNSGVVNSVVVIWFIINTALLFI